MPYTVAVCKFWVPMIDWRENLSENLPSASYACHRRFEVMRMRNCVTVVRLQKMALKMKVLSKKSRTIWQFADYKNIANDQTINGLYIYDLLIESWIKL